MDFVEYFDVRVLNALYASTQICIAVIFLLIYHVYKKSYINQMTVGSVIKAVGISLITFRFQIPIFFSVFLGNTFLIVGLYITYDGMVIMANQKGHVKKLITLSIIFSALHITFIYIYPNVTYRVINFSVFSILGALYLVYQYSKVVFKFYQHVYLIIIVSHVGHIILMGYRIIDAFINNNMEILFTNKTLLKYIILYSIFISIGRVISVILYNTKDLVRKD